ncbi:MAG: hypothetical protein ACRECE_06085, partial [Xanthobacteraceae bacterium]
MAVRQERVELFITTELRRRTSRLELLCEDRVGTYVIPFLCRWRNGDWQSLETDKCIEARGAWLAGVQPRSTLN